MSTYTMDTLQSMQANAERIARKTWQGEVAGPRTFVKPGVYSAEELKRSWRSTIWDEVPSLMGGQRHYRVSE
jgi:hypothetical protein